MPISDSGNPDIVEHLSWEMFGKLLNHLHRGWPITEEDVAFLLRLFGHSPNRTQDERLERIDDTITTEDSLKWAALHYGKDPRTIRNWCEKGFFPSAYKTKTSGGHWRIPFSAIMEAEKHLPTGFFRKPKTLLGSPEWAQLKPKLKEIFSGVKAAFETHAGIHDVSATELRSDRPKVSVAAVDAMLRAYEKGILPYLRVQLAARRIYTGNPTKRITRQMLASETGTSVAGLYRHFGTEKIERLIRQASRPFKSGDENAEALEALGEVDAIFLALEGFNERGVKVDFAEGETVTVTKRTPKRGKPTR